MELKEKCPMIKLIDLGNSGNIFTGKIFWDMLRPGVRLAVLGPEGCLTSVIKTIFPGEKEGSFCVETRNTTYLLESTQGQPMVWEPSLCSGA
tara:strand:- start:301 stop:576 length:276 start_codon:yes stop_codon:yes gene_type:complete